MSSISQCQNDIQRYKILKTKINSIISKLSLVINNTDDLSSEIRSKYQVNDSDTPIVTRIKTLNEEIEKTNSYLRSKVLPAIDVAITKLNKEIDRLTAEQESIRDYQIKKFFSFK